MLQALHFFPSFLLRTAIRTAVLVFFVLFFTKKYPFSLKISAQEDAILLIGSQLKYSKK